ncbi:type I-F CRISPR-associated endonuclease Cas1f [Acidithiobacillus sp.]|uniref:type I-F CRISPR-associated endonuclease Cas1f n=1 Tax=Acidithiobacillus sp. TaxID=1872118 RepID=UPI0025C4AA74|nr:type I-F CRISPR-associated endonuclease Cas1f [Acidithiobacillus sp.]MCK9188997.1 type I-F CRISPR-associated endonuclease Cas1f [Acidithiobacillus sp.]MCK9359342.1 type I-F CRISPR-associated endonuclease Cas1f [Acidithiobacillus sp.]
MSRPPPKTAQILLSKRANVMYIEHARVMVKDGRVIYLTEFKDGTDRGFNIPDKNTAFLLLGKGTSVTDGAVRMLAESGVIIGFCGSGGAPLIAGVDMAFITPQSEYRPTEYMQTWMRLWLNEEKRLNAARNFMIKRLEFTLESWDKQSIVIPDAVARKFEGGIQSAQNTGQLLSVEGDWAKALYGVLARKYKLDDFRREDGKRSREDVPATINGFLDHGNYIAYGYAGVSLYALGISYALPLLHGKTRRGALVFDVADLIKDATVMPLAFEFGSKGVRDQEFRTTLIQQMQLSEATDMMIDTIKETIEKST